MLAILLALVSAIGYGCSDFSAGLASRAAGAIQVSLFGTAVATVIILAALPFAAGRLPGAASLAWGLAAGVGGTSGGLALYLGFRYAAFSVAAPVSAVGSAGFSVLAGLLFGERPTTLALTGIALALPAIIAVSATAAASPPAPPTPIPPLTTPPPPPAPPIAPATPAAPLPPIAPAASVAPQTPIDPEPPFPAPSASPVPAPDPGAQPPHTAHASRPAAGVIAGLVAGAGFALLFIGLDRAGSHSGLWPVAATQAAELLMALVVAAVTRNVRLPGARARRLVLATGLASATGTISFFFASHAGYLAVTAVLTSLYPAVTIMLARTVLGERLTALRLAGLTLAAACVALIAVGGAS